VVTYRSDEQYHAAYPEIPFPASWHRAVVARIAQEVPGLAIAYPDERRPDQETGPSQRANLDPTEKHKAAKIGRVVARLASGGRREVAPRVMASWVLCSSNGVSTVPVPEWWSYPRHCQYGHAWGPGRAIGSCV